MTANHRRDLLDMIDKLRQRVSDLESSRALGLRPLCQAVLTGPASSVRVPASGSIPQGFTNLRLVISAQGDNTGGTSGYDNASMQFNGVTTSNYNWQTWYRAFGGAISAAEGTSVSSMQCAAVWNSHFVGSAGRGISTIDIPNYSDANNLKSFTAQSFAADGGAAGVMQEYGGSLGAGHIEPITSLTILMGTGSFVADSTFSLYGS